MSIPVNTAHQACSSTCLGKLVGDLETWKAKLSGTRVLSYRRLIPCVSYLAGSFLAGAAARNGPIASSLSPAPGLAPDLKLVTLTVASTEVSAAAVSGPVAYESNLAPMALSAATFKRVSILYYMNRSRELDVSEADTRHFYPFLLPLSLPGSIRAFGVNADCFAAFYHGLA